MSFGEGAIYLRTVDVVWEEDQITFELVDDPVGPGTPLNHVRTGTDTVGVSLPQLPVGTHKLRWKVGQGENVLASGEIHFFVITYLQTDPEVVSTSELPREISLSGFGLSFPGEGAVPVTFESLSGDSLVINASSVDPDGTLHLSLPQDMGAGMYSISVTCNGVQVYGSLQILYEPTTYTLRGTITRADGAPMNWQKLSFFPVPLGGAAPVIVDVDPLGVYTAELPSDGLWHLFAVHVDGMVYELPLTNYSVNVVDRTTQFDIVLPDGWPALVHPAVIPPGSTGTITVIPINGGITEVTGYQIKDATGTTVRAGSVTHAANSVSFELQSGLDAGVYRVVLSGVTGPVAEGSLTVGAGPQLNVVVEQRPEGWYVNFFPGFPDAALQAYLVPLDGGPIDSFYMVRESPTSGFGLLRTAPPLGRYVFAVATQHAIVTTEGRLGESEEEEDEGISAPHTLQGGIANIAFEVTGSVIRADSEVAVFLENSLGGEPLFLEVYDRSEGSLRVLAREALASGNYTLVVMIDGKRYTADLVVKTEPMFLGMNSSQPASYPEQVVKLRGGDRWTFAEDHMPQIQILDYNDNVPVRTLTPVFVSDKEVQVTFPAGLRSGIYMLSAAMSKTDTTGQWIYVGLDLDPALQAGVSEQTITATAAGVTFEEGTTVSINAPGVTVSDVQVLDSNRSQIRFTLHGELPKAFVTITVTKPDNYRIQHGEFVGYTSPTTRTAQLTDWNDNPMAGVKVWISRADEYPGKSTGFVTEADGSFKLTLPAGDYIVNWWEDATGRQNCTYLAFAITDDQTQYVLKLPAPNVKLYVRDDRGNAVPGARVWIRGLSQDDPLRGGSISATTDAGGTAQLYLPPAEYEVSSIEVPGYLPDERPQFVVKPDGVEEVYVTLKRPNVMGSVRFAGEETEPVAWAKVTFHAESGWYGRTTDANGLLAYDLNPGETYYLAEVVLSEEQGSHQYYFGQRYPVPLEDEDDCVTVDVELPALNAHGEAKIAGQPVAEGQLLILPKGEYWPLEVPIRDGRWELYLADGDYSITGIQVDGHTFETAWIIHVEEGQTLPGIIVQPKPVKVAAGVALENEQVSLPGHQLPLGDSAVLTLRNESGEVPGVQVALASVGDYEVVVSLTGMLAPGWYTLRAVEGARQYDWVLEAERVPNLQAVLRDKDGNPVRNAWVKMTLASEWPRPGSFDLTTDRDGRLAADVPVGDYVIYRWHAGGRTQATYIPVSITSDTDYRANPTVLTEPDHTLFIRIYDVSGLPAAGFTAVLRRHDGDQPIGWGAIEPMADATGLAAMYLPPGYYWIEAVYKEGSQRVGMRVTIDDSGRLLNENNEPVDEVEIHLTPDNLEGTVMFQGQWVPNVHITFRAEGDFQVSSTGSDGYFTVQLLPNKTYYVDQVTYSSSAGTLRWILGTMYPIVVNEEGVAAPAFLRLVLPEMNLHGSARIGGREVPEGYVILSPAAEPGRNIEVHVWDGTWMIFLPDGEYHIHRVVLGERIYPTDVRFRVEGGMAIPGIVNVEPMRTNVYGAASNQFGQGIHYGWIQFRSGTQVVYAPVSEGQYQVYLDPAQTWHAYSVAAGPDRFELDPPVSITVGVRNDIAVPRPTLAATIRDEADRLMPLVQVVIRGEGQEYWATSNTEGQIAANLLPGTYEVMGWQYGRPLVFDQPITVPTGPEPVVLRVSMPNVTGTVLAEDGSAAEHASLRAVNTKTEDEVVLRADSQGRFGARLEGDFCIREVTGRSFWFRTNTCFTAKAGEPVDLVVRPRAANVSGTVRTSDGQPIGYAQVGFRDAAGETVWTRADLEGRFRLALEPGRHRVVAIGTAAGWVEVRQDIDVPVDAPLTVDVVWPPTTATGRVQQVNGQPMRYASVLFTSTLPGVEAVSSQADASGQFGAALPAGEWLVAGIYDSEAQVFHSLENRALRVAVQPDQSAPVNVGVLKPLTPNVSGRVYADRALTAVVHDSWLTITSDEPTGQSVRTYWAKTDALGNFSLYLEPGRYVVRSVAGESGYVLNLRFTVPSGQLTVVPPEAYVEGRVELPGVTGPVQVAIRPVDGAGEVSHDAASTLWITTEPDGTWRAVLADGSYAVIAVDTAEDRHAVDVRFEVEGGTAPEVVVTQ